MQHEPAAQAADGPDLGLVKMGRPGPGPVRGREHWGHGGRPCAAEINTRPLPTGNDGLFIYRRELSHKVGVAQPGRAAETPLPDNRTQPCVTIK